MTLPASSSLHVGLITPAYAGVNALDSGIGVHFRHLADGLLEAGHQVTVVLPVESGKPLQVPPAHVTVVNVPVSVTARLAGRLHWQLHQWLSERALRAGVSAAAGRVHVDIWETTSTGAPALSFLGQTSRAAVVTRVSTTASQLRTTNAGKSTWLTRRNERHERAAIVQSEAVITHSESHRAAILQEFGLPPAAVPINPHGIPLPPVCRRSPGSDLRLLYVGRLEHRKGIDLLLAALRVALPQVPELRAILVGTDSGQYWQRHWRESAPAGMVERVEFAGPIPGAALATEFQHADLFAAPSRYESFGLMFVEAMAWSLPVIALAAPGASEVLVADETALLTPAEDAGALAAAITRMARSPEMRKRFGAAGRRRAERLYSRTALTEASVGFYRQVISRFPRSQRRA